MTLLDTTIPAHDKAESAPTPQAPKPETSAQGASQTSPRTPTWDLMKRLIKGYLRPHMWNFIVAAMFMGLAAAMTGLFTLQLETVINGVFQKKGLGYLVLITLSIMLVFFVRGLATYAHTVAMNKIGQKIVTTVQREMYAHLLRADLAFFHANASGALMSRLTNDVAVMRQAVGECLTNAIKGPLSLAFLIGAMFYQDWQLSVLTFTVFPFSAWFVARMGKRMRKLSANTQEVTGDFAALLSQTFQGIRHVKAYGMEDRETQAVHDVTHRIYKLTVKGYHISALTNPVMEVLSALAIGLILVYGGHRADAGHLTPGSLVAFVTAFILAYDPMKRMARVNTQLQSGLAAADRVFALLDVKPEIVDAPDAVELVAQDTSIVLQDVVFTYVDGTVALDHVAITVPHGKTVALVGASGAGKSTIINLIPRFYDIQQGRITIGGQNIRDVTMSSLRRHIALVSQETALFDDTVRGNIAYGLKGASDEQVVAAARAAYAHDFIMSLPQGYDTVVGEHGVKLSGGQRQRLAIARAMLRNAPILLLDEATSALDNESERAVQAALKTLQQGRTTVVVAHRLSTIVDADLIIVMDKGRVVEQGTHAQLLQAGGAYARLYGMQDGQGNGAG